MANNFSEIQSGAEKLLDEITLKVKDLDKEITELNTNVTKLFSTSSKNSGLNDRVKTLETEISKLNNVINKQKTQTTQLVKAKESLNKKTSEEIINQRALAKASDIEARSKSKLVGAYQRLNARRLIAKKRLQDLIVSHGKNNLQVKKAQREYDRLTRKVNMANKATSNFSKTGLGRMATGFKNLIGGFGLVLGIQLLGDFTRAVFNNLKELDKLDFALRTVIKNEGELARTRAFLNDVSIRYGAEIVSTTERYTKFMVAARQSGLALKKTEDIFRTMTKASAVLGLKTHELEGIYLALEQMLSKGKVTTEELRRQLGERLPGAFGIMADAVGVTTIELDKMLRKGEILSADVLPAFAEEVEKALGIETVNRVVTLQTSWTNLSNSWTMLIDNLRTGQGWISKVLIFTFYNLSTALQDLGAIMTGTDAILERNTFAKMFKSLQDGNVTMEDANNLLKENQDLIALRGESAEGAGLFKGRIKAIEAYIKLLKDAAKQEKIDRDALINKIALKDKTLKLADLEAMSLKELRDLWAKLNIESGENNKIIKEKEKALKFASSGASSFRKEMELLLKITKEAKRLYSDNSKEAELLAEKIEILENAINPLNEVLEDGEEHLKDFFKTWENGQKTLDNENKRLEDAKNALSDFFGEFEDDFFSKAGFDFLGSILTDIDGFKQLLADAPDSDKWKVWATSIMEVTQEAFNFINQTQTAQFDAQYERLEKQKDIALMFAGESVSAREDIERQYEAKRKAIQRQQAKSQKEQSLFNIAIDTAQAVIATLAETPPPAGIPLAIAVGAIGAAQLALVAATPVPEFFRGTQNAPEGWAMVDEKRPEIHTDNKGNIKSTGENSANMRWLNRGDKIYSSREEYFKKELTSVLGSNDILPYNQMFDMVSPTVNVEQGLKKEDFVRQIKSLKTTIENKEGIIINADKNGFSASRTRNGHTRELQNNILRLKTREI